jgi:hypothetical protein
LWLPTPIEHEDVFDRGLLYIAAVDHGALAGFSPRRYARACSAKMSLRLPRLMLGRRPAAIS